MTDFEELKRRVLEKYSPILDNVGNDENGQILRAIHEISIKNAVRVLFEYEKMMAEKNQ